jgi:hypothetical protein
MDRHMLLVSVLTLSCCISGCKRSTTPPSPASAPASTAAENKQRAALNLRQVKANWYLYGIEFGEEVWKIRSSDPSGAKQIKRDADGGLVWEGDYYYSGATFATIDGTQWEMIQVVYNWVANESGGIKGAANELSVDYVGQNPAVSALLDTIKPTSTNAEKLSVVDQILKMWGIPRL